MQRNPYSPPESPVKEEIASLAPRPIAVWLLLIVLAAIATMFVVGVVRFASLAWHGLLASGDMVDWAIALGWRLASGVVAIAALVGVFRRKVWAQWAGVICIASLALLSMLGPHTAAYANDAERSGGYAFRFVILPLLSAWWIRTFGFTRKARRYFGRHEA